MKICLKVLIFVFVLAGCSVCTGGYGPLVQPDEDIRRIVQDLKGDIEGSLDRKLDWFDVVEYRQQVVQGINYRVKVKTNDGRYLVLQIYKRLPFDKAGLVELKSVLEVESSDVPI